MRKVLLCTVSALFCLGMVSSCEKDASGITDVSSESNLNLDERGRNATVSGHVEVELDSTGHHQKYTFNAVMHKDGSVKGEFQLFDFLSDSTELVAHGDVECFTIQDDGRTAWLGGVVERGSLDSMNYVGAEVYWTVVDNGQGSKADPDEASEMVYSLDGVLADDHCTDGAGTFVYMGPIIRSNVTVKN